jgi:hypothetical protein
LSCSTKSSARSWTRCKWSNLTTLKEHRKVYRQIHLQLVRIPYTLNYSQAICKKCKLLIRTSSKMELVAHLPSIRTCAFFAQVNFSNLFSPIDSIEERQFFIVPNSV